MDNIKIKRAICKMQGFKYLPGDIITYRNFISMQTVVKCSIDKYNDNYAYYLVIEEGCDIPVKLSKHFVESRFFLAGVLDEYKSK